MAAVAVAILGGIAAAVAAGHWWTVGRFIEDTDDAYVGGDVTVIAPEVAGFITNIAVADNQAVHAGDVLIQLDDRNYRAALAQADAAVTMQQAALRNLDARRHLQEAVVTQAQAAIAATDAEITRAHDDQLRDKNLLSTAAIALKVFQQADADYKQAVAAGEKAHAGLAAAQRELEVIATEKLQIQAALEQAVAERDRTKLDLEYTTLRAPIDGTVGNRSARTGAYAISGAQLLSLVPARGLWVDANFKENQLARIRPGLPAVVHVDSLPGQVFHGRVVTVAPATGSVFSILPPENATGNFTKIVQRVTVRIQLEDTAASRALRPGLSATVEVDTHAPQKEVL